jgi:hypothetical protein
MGEWKYSSTILNLTLDGVSDQLDTLTALPPGIRSQVAI